MRLRPGTAVVVVFTAVAAGSIIANPLLPLYRVRLGLSWTALALAFCVNLIALVAALGWGARRAAHVRPEALVLAAVSLSLSADVAGVLARGQAWAVFGSRALAGASVGIVTGAAANLMVRQVGDRGRSLVALGSLVGAALGLTTATLMVELLPAPFVLVYLVHGGSVLAAGVLWAWTARVRRPLTLAPAALLIASVPAPSESFSGLVAQRVRPRRRAFVAAALAWAAGGVLVGYLPSVAQDTMGLTSQIGTQASAFAFQGIAGIVALGGATLPRWTGLTGLVVGCTSSAAALALGSLPLLLVGCALAGMGQAVTYTEELLVVSAGASPAEQGEVSSRYSQVAYCASAAMVLTAGAVGSLVDPEVGLVAVLAVIAAGSLLVRPRAPRP
jgi:hypothetical protein